MDKTTSMEPEKKCPQCGGAVPGGAPEGLCPGCLLKQGTETATQPRAPHFEPPSIEEVKRLFPQLEIVALIGKGGMGAVYKARQPALDRYVALKILPAATSASAQKSANGPGEPIAGFGERFNREARALARLSHPHIVAVYEFGQAGDLPFFIMEFVDGANLRQLQRERRFSTRDALALVGQICDALQYAHDEGIVHRDIKPENILVDRKGRVKIADFGLAKILDYDPEALRLTEAGQSMGTPHYMAPEQVEHPQEVDHRADIFSLGVVFYELLTGELPLGKFPPPSRKVQIDVRLDDVVLRTLEKEPERRYQQASEVRSRVETIAQMTGEGQPVNEAPPRASQQRRTAWRSFWWIVLFMFLLLEPIRLAADKLGVSSKGVLHLLVVGELIALALGIMAHKWKRGKTLVALAAVTAITCISVETWRSHHSPRSTVWDRLDREIFKRLVADDVQINSLGGHLDKLDLITFTVNGSRKGVPFQDTVKARDMHNGLWNARGSGSLSNLVFDVRTGTRRFYWLKGGNSFAHFPTDTNDPALTESKATPDFRHAESALGAIERLGDQLDGQLEKGDQLAAKKTMDLIVGLTEFLRASVVGTPAELPSDRYLLCQRTRDALEADNLALAKKTWEAFGAVNSRADEDYTRKISGLALAQQEAAEKSKQSLDPRITQLDQDYLEEQLKEIEHKQAVGAATPLDYQKARAKRDIAAALARGDNLEAARLKLELATIELNVLEKMAEVGRATAEEVRTAKYQRGHAEIDYQTEQEKRASLRERMNPMLRRD